MVLSALTIALMILSNSLWKDNSQQNAKVKSILTSYWNDRESYPLFWNNLQTTYECCGVNGSLDWEWSVPLSCYQTQTTCLIWRKTVTRRYPHENGCYRVIVEYLQEITSWFKFIGLGFVSLGVFGIVGMLLSGCLYFVDHQKKSPMDVQI